MNSPMSPGHSASGKNAASVVPVDAMMGQATSPTVAGRLQRTVPFIHKTVHVLHHHNAVVDEHPRANTSENNTIVLNVTPIQMRKLMNMDSGMATPTNSALRKPRKNKSTPTTSKPQK